MCVCDVSSQSTPYFSFLDRRKLDRSVLFLWRGWAGAEGLLLMLLHRLALFCGVCRTKLSRAGPGRVETLEVRAASVLGSFSLAATALRVTWCTKAAVASGASHWRLPGGRDAGTLLSESDSTGAKTVARGKLCHPP